MGLVPGVGLRIVTRANGGEEGVPIRAAGSPEIFCRCPAVGEKIPVDGVVTDGASYTTNRMITGEAGTASRRTRWKAEATGRNDVEQERFHSHESGEGGAATRCLAYAYRENGEASRSCTRYDSKIGGPWSSDRTIFVIRAVIASALHDNAVDVDGVGAWSHATGRTRWWHACPLPIISVLPRAGPLPRRSSVMVAD